MNIVLFIMVQVLVLLEILLVLKFQFGNYPVFFMSSSVAHRDRRHRKPLYNRNTYRK